MAGVKAERRTDRKHFIKEIAVERDAAFWANFGQPGKPNTRLGERWLNDVPQGAALLFHKCTQPGPQRFKFFTRCQAVGGAINNTS